MCRIPRLNFPLFSFPLNRLSLTGHDLDMVVLYQHQIIG